MGMIVKCYKQIIVIIYIFYSLFFSIIITNFVITITIIILIIIMNAHQGAVILSIFEKIAHPEVGIGGNFSYFAP